MLFKWENNEVVVAPEALAIQAFKNIWDADKSKGKARAMNTLSLLYFTHDPRSEYLLYDDEKERVKMIKEHLGIEGAIEKDKLFMAAVPVYVSLTRTKSSELLKANTNALNSVKEYLKHVTVVDENISKVVKAVSEINALAVDIAKAEKAIHAEVEEKLNNARGNARLTIGDEGLERIFGSEKD
jgi:hypothetical protein